MAHENFDEMVAYCRLDDHFGPPATMVCPSCDKEMVLTGLSKDQQHGFIECTGCGLAIGLRFMPELPERRRGLPPGTHPLETLAPGLLEKAQALLSKEKIEWCLEKGRREAEIAVPRPGANIEALEHSYREWLKNNPEPA